MSQFVKLSKAQVAEANEIYASIDFQLSDPERDVTFGKLEDGAFIALGRLQRHEDGALELGGFWVRADRRGTGIARALVGRIVEEVPIGEEAWCIPFDYLVAFYQSCGMEPPNGGEGVPRSIESKLKWCNECYQDGAYDSPVQLLRLRHH